MIHPYASTSTSTLVQNASSHPHPHPHPPAPPPPSLPPPAIPISYNSQLLNRGDGTGSGGKRSAGGGEGMRRGSSATSGTSMFYESSVSSSAPSVISYIRRPSVSNPPQAPSSTPPDLPRSTSSSKTLLQDALAKAQSAVLLDAANNVTGAISAYSESVRLLRVVMRMVEEKGRREKEKEDARERDGAVGEEERERRRGRREKREKDKEDEARRLRVIHDTYQDRITMLLQASREASSPLTPTHAHPHSPYPPSPTSPNTQAPSVAAHQAQYPPSPTTPRLSFQTTPVPPVVASPPPPSSSSGFSNPFSQSNMSRRPSVASLSVIKDSPTFSAAAGGGSLSTTTERPSPPPSPMDPMMRYSPRPLPTTPPFTQPRPMFPRTSSSTSTSPIKTSRISLVPSSVQRKPSLVADDILRGLEEDGLALPEMAGYSVGDEDEEEDGARRTSIEERSITSFSGRAIPTTDEANEEEETDPYGGISNSPLSPLTRFTNSNPPQPPPKDPFSTSPNPSSIVLLDSTREGTISKRRKSPTNFLGLKEGLEGIGKPPGVVVRPASTEPTPLFTEFGLPRHQHTSSSSSTSSTSSQPPQQQPSTAPASQQTYSTTSLPLPLRLRTLSQPGKRPSLDPPPLPQPRLAVTIGVGFPTQRKSSIPTPTSTSSILPPQHQLIRTTSISSTSSRGPSPIPPQRSEFTPPTTTPTPYAPPPSSPPRKPFHLMRLLLTTIETGGFLTPRLYIPKEMWSQPGVKLVAVETKVRMMDVLGTAVEGIEGGEWGRFERGLEGVEGVLGEVRGTLERKLGYGLGGKKMGATSFSAWSSKLSRSLDRVTNGRSLDSPALYVEGIARLFRQSQIIDNHLHLLQTQSSFYSHLPAHQLSSIEQRLKKCSDFFGQVIVQFVLRDLGLMLDKYVKRGGNWVGND